VSDLHAIFASTSGKLELEYGTESGDEARVVDRLLDVAVKAVFDEQVDLEMMSPVLEYMGEGWGVAVSDTMPAADYIEGIASIRGLCEAIQEMGVRRLFSPDGESEPDPVPSSPGLMASAAEFIFEGLHLNERFSTFDSSRKIPHGAPGPKKEITGCICPDILKGKAEPPQCELFGIRCRPDNPVGACMVSREGACHIWHRYSAK